MVVPKVWSSASHSHGTTLCAGYDMYNHRNGKYHNTDVWTEVDVKHVTKASRDIQKGEQIHNSYNRCRDCRGRRLGYGTAGTCGRMMRFSLHGTDDSTIHPVSPPH